MYRNPKLLQAVRDCPCQHCGVQDSTIVAAHSNQMRDGKGRGLKASDAMIAALCYTCHMEIDQGNKLSRQERVEIWEQAHRKTMQLLIESGRLIVSSSV